MREKMGISWIASLGRYPFPHILCILLFLILLSDHYSTPPTTQLHPVSPSPSFSPPANLLSTTLSAAPDAALALPLDPTATFSYHRHLELTTSPATQLTHSPTLTFSAIYVLSLPNRLDRREQMTKLAKALGLKIVFVDAFSKKEPFVKWIAERVKEVRARKRALMAKARGVNSSTVGGLKVGSVWVSRSQDSHGVVPFPKMKDSRWSKGDWVAELEKHWEEGTLDLLKPEEEDTEVFELLNDPLDREKNRQVNDAVISTFFGHTRAMKLMLQNGDKSALIMEDDLDAEFDIERMWARIERQLPHDWSLTYLGHCWGKELLSHAHGHPLLHASVAPMCLTAYALTSSGASQLLEYLLDPWTAFQVPIDTHIPTLISSSLLSSFSIEPPLIIQRKDGPSDIHESFGTKWRGLLRDSTVHRILLDEWNEKGGEKSGEPRPVEDSAETTKGDPALAWRYRCSNNAGHAGSGMQKLRKETRE